MSKSAHTKNIFLLAETFLQRKQLFSTTAIIARQDSKLMSNLGVKKNLSKQKLYLNTNLQNFSEQSSLRQKPHTT